VPAPKYYWGGHRCCVGARRGRGSQRADGSGGASGRCTAWGSDTLLCMALAVGLTT
jgi:hypothetical protein